MKNKNNSKYNVRRELVKLECRDCGADLEMLDETYAQCKFCGQKYIVNELLERIPEAPTPKKPQPVAPKTVKPQTNNQQQKNAMAAIWVIMIAIVMMWSVLFLILKNNARDSSGDRNSLWDGDIIMVGTQEKDENEDDRTEKWEIKEILNTAGVVPYACFSILTA